MLIARGAQRDRSLPGRLLGATRVFVYDTDASLDPVTTRIEELPHTIRLAFREAGPGLERRIETAVDEVREGLTRLAKTSADRAMRGVKRGTKAYREASERASQLGRFVTNAEELVRLEGTSEQEGVVYTVETPVVPHRQLGALTSLIADARQAHELIGSSTRSARAIIPVYSVVEERAFETHTRRRTIEAVRQLGLEEALALPRLTYDLEVTDYLPRFAPDLSGTSREELFETLEELAANAGYAFDPEPFRFMDEGMLRKHANLFADLERDERIYDAAVLLPSGAQHDITSLPGARDRFELDDGTIVHVHRALDQQAILDTLAKLARSEPVAILLGHNHIAYDFEVARRLGGLFALGADATEVKTRFAVPGSIAETLLLPDGTPIKEHQHAYLSDRGFYGLDAFDAAALMRYIDELPNGKLAELARLIGKDKEAIKIYSHEQLEAIAQASAAAPEKSPAILREAGLDEDLEAHLAQEQRYSANDVRYPVAIAERLLPVFFPIAAAFEATLSEICTTSPEKHALDAWERYRAGRAPPKPDPIEDERHRGRCERERFTAQAAHAYADTDPKETGVRDAIVARRSEGLVLARHVTHPTLERLVTITEGLEGYERAWAMRYVDAMLTEPLYSALATSGRELARHDHAWRLRQDPQAIGKLAEAYFSLPHAIGAVRASRKYLVFEANERGEEALAKAATAGLAFEVDRGVALMLERGFSFRGSSELLNGYADPMSMRGARVPFSHEPLIAIHDAILDLDPERALDELADAYVRFENAPDDEPELQRSQVLNRDARDFSSTTKSEIIEYARSIDARKGERVTLPFDRARMRELLFGLPQENPEPGLFGARYERKPQEAGVLTSLVHAAFGTAAKRDFERWHQLTYAMQGDADARAALIEAFETLRRD